MTANRTKKRTRRLRSETRIVTLLERRATSSAYRWGYASASELAHLAAPTLAMEAAESPRSSLASSDETSRSWSEIAPSS